MRSDAEGNGRVDWSRVADFERSRAEDICRHFFPAGRKCGPEWKIGDLSGAAGDSLGIQIEGPKAGLWHDRATGDRGRLRNAIARNRGIPDENAVEEIGKAFGVSFGLNGHRNGSGNHFDWNDHVNAVTDSELAELTPWRGYSREFCRWLKDRKLIGRRGNYWAFPVQLNDEIVAAHIRRAKHDWFFEPKLRDLGVRNQALIVGDLTNAAKVFIAESQWDLFAAFDVTAAYQTDGIAGIATRGSRNGGLLSALISGRCEVILFPQNDEAGVGWLDNCAAMIGRKVRVVRTPPEFEDFNAWTVGATNKEDVIRGVTDAEEFTPKKGNGNTDQETPLIDKIRQGVCSAKDLLTMAVKPRAKLLDQWFCEGDLGLIFAPRGVGKTWFVMAMSTAIVQGSAFGPWQASSKFPVLIIDGEMPCELTKQRTQGLQPGNENLLFLNHEILFDRSGISLNLATQQTQEAITAICIETGIKVLVLDNLSTLFSGMKENESDSWERVLKWLLDLRRKKIAIIIIHHSGRNKEMRGTSRREDSRFGLFASTKKLHPENAGTVHVS